MEKILFYGALGYPDKKVVGGGESGNLKTIEILNRIGYTIIKIYKPYPKLTFFGLIWYFLALLVAIFRVFFKLILNKEIRVVHLSGFYMHLIYQEYLIILITKLLGRSCIYELRGGGVEKSFFEGTNIYRFFFKRSVLLADQVLSQGEKYLLFLKKIGVKKVHHYPNYVNSIPELSNEALKRNESKEMEIVYFGRIAESKNIGLIIDVCKFLRDNSYNFSMEIIGNGKEVYMRKIIDSIAKNDLQNYIKISNALFGEELLDELKKKHFFLFPSIEPREGHSNSLTEAMSLGIVPIVSDIGFNRDIVAVDDLIVENYLAKEYGEKIIDIWDSNNWQLFSKIIRERIAKNFTMLEAEKILENVYSSISKKS